MSANGGVSFVVGKDQVAHLSKQPSENPRSACGHQHRVSAHSLPLRYCLSWQNCDAHIPHFDHRQPYSQSHDDVAGDVSFVEGKDQRGHRSRQQESWVPKMDHPEKRHYLTWCKRIEKMHWCRPCVAAVVDLRAAGTADVGTYRHPWKTETR